MKLLSKIYYIHFLLHCFLNLLKIFQLFHIKSKQQCGSYPIMNLKAHK